MSIRCYPKTRSSSRASDAKMLSRACECLDFGCKGKNKLGIRNEELGIILQIGHELAVRKVRKDVF